MKEGDKVEGSGKTSAYRRSDVEQSEVARSSACRYYGVPWNFRSVDWYNSLQPVAGDGCRSYQSESKLHGREAKGEYWEADSLSYT